MGGYKHLDKKKYDSAVSNICKFMKDPSKEKYAAIEKTLEDDYVLVHVNTLNDLLAIPEHLKAKSSVTLRISRWFKGRMDLYEDRIDAELLFSDVPFACSVPLDSVWGITNVRGESLVWPVSAPPDALIAMTSPAMHPASQKAPKQKPKKTKEPTELPSKGHLKRVK